MNGYCFDTDIIGAPIKSRPSMPLVRRLAALRPDEQFTTSVTVAELLHGARRVGRSELTDRVEEVVRSAQTVLPCDVRAARVFAGVKAELERRGQPIAEPDLRIASIALSRDLVMVTRNVRHFERVPNLVVQNWIDEAWRSESVPGAQPPR